MLLIEDLLNAADDAAVIDGVADLAAFRRMFATQSDFKIELDGLRDGFFPLVNADQRFNF